MNVERFSFSQGLSPDFPKLGDDILFEFLIWVLVEILLEAMGSSPNVTSNIMRISANHLTHLIPVLPSYRNHSIDLRS